MLGIGRYTLRTWGEDQSIRYVDDLEACCQMLAENPTLGRAYDHIRPGLRRRMERGQRRRAYFNLHSGSPTTMFCQLNPGIAE